MTSIDKKAAEVLLGSFNTGDRTAAAKRAKDVAATMFVRTGNKPIDWRTVVDVLRNECQEAAAQ